MEQKQTNTILIIDDEAAYREIIGMTLGVMGYDVVEATNGLDGLAAAKMHHPDLILCDINMPKMDGHALLHALREEQEFSGIPFIFLTGNSAPGDLRKGMQEGADDYLMKPFTADELIAAVQARLSQRTKMRKYIESQFDDIKSNIVHALPHEFRTPLNGVLGFSQILMEDPELPPSEVKEIGTMIYRSGQRLNRLLENMVLYGQLQLWTRDPSKKEELHTADITSISEVLPLVVEQVAVRHERLRDIRTVATDRPIAMSSLRLMKILEEALDNAVKFSAAGSEVVLTAEDRQTSVLITVTDHGRGMSAEQLKRISGFQQFERGYYEQQGAGLGLAIIQMMAEVHGGTVAIDSAEGTGTTLRITLPAAER